MEVLLDPQMLLDWQVSVVARGFFCPALLMCQWQLYLSESDLTTMVSDLSVFHLDYCNALKMVLTLKIIQKSHSAELNGRLFLGLTSLIL